MNRFVILGAGRQGCAVAAFLLEQFSDTAVDFVDRDHCQLEAACRLQRSPERVATHVLDAARPGDDLRRLFAAGVCVVSCVPYFLNLELTRAAIQAGTPFTDLGGNIGTVRAQLALIDDCRAAGVAIAPDSGLAPGLLNVLAEHWAREWSYRSVRLYCGGLPQNPSGPLQYALTFNFNGLLNEYFDDCEMSLDGQVRTRPGMSDVEALRDLALPGEFEAFATSGGASLGPVVYAPRDVDYQYKTIRHPGHCALVGQLRDLGLFDAAVRDWRIADTDLSASPWQISGALLGELLASDGKDLVVARADVRGEQDGQPRRGRIDLLDYAVDRFTAMERTTGFPTAVVAAALAGLYEAPIEPGAYVPFQVIDPQLMISELARAGITGITTRQIDVVT